MERTTILCRACGEEIEATLPLIPGGVLSKGYCSSGCYGWDQKHKIAACDHGDYTCTCEVA